MHNILLIHRDLSVWHI